MNIDIDVMERETQGRYHFRRLLGQGTFGMVFEATDLQSGKPVAIKRIRNIFDSPLQAKRILREIRLMRKLNHENITNLLDVRAPTLYEDFDVIYFVIDLMDTDLAQLMQRTTQLRIEHRRFFLYQIMKALKYLHSANVVHRDIKPENLLVNTKSELRITDFGLTRVIDDPYAPDLQNEAILTRWYRAPEVLLNMRNYGSPIDIWSVGCVLAEMMLGKVLFQGQSNLNMLTLMIDLLGSPTAEDFRQIVNPSARKFMDSLPKKSKGSFDDIFRSYDSDEVDLLRRMLTWNPEARITVDDVLKHRFLAELHDPFDEPVSVAMSSFDFEKPSVTTKELKDLLWKEIQQFRTS